MAVRQKTDDLRLMSKDFLTEFLKIYREEECLWETKHRCYSDRNSRARSYARLVEKMREADKNADESYVKKKINALRTNYRAEWNKLQLSIAAGEDPPYRPKLWYFQLLKFLGEHPEKSANESLNTMNSSNGLKDEMDDEYCPSEYLDCGETSSHKIKHEESPANRPPRKRLHLQSEDILDKLSDILDKCEQDESDLVGKNVASKLRRLPPDMRIYAEKLLNDVLFEAQLGTLNRDSYVVTHHYPN